MPEKSGYLGIRTPIFGQQKEESFLSPTQTPMQAPNLDDGMQAPEQDTRLLDQYHEVLGRKPERRNPTLWQKIGATLSAIGGDKEGMERNLYGNYHRNMQDWETELATLEKGVGIEGRANTENMRQAMNEFNQRMQTEKLDLERQKVAITDMNAQTRIADVERKYNEAIARLQLAYDQLAARQNDAAAQREFRQVELDATNARHALQMALAEARLEEQKRVNDARVNQINERLAEDGLRVTVTDNGQWIVTRTERRGQDARDQLEEVIIYNPQTDERRLLPKTEIPNLRPPWSVVRETDIQLPSSGGTR